jgi:hypothetical protein
MLQMQLHIEAITETSIKSLVFRLGMEVSQLIALSRRDKSSAGLWSCLYSPVLAKEVMVLMGSPR